MAEKKDLPSDSRIPRDILASHLLTDARVDWSNPELPSVPFKQRTAGLEANRRYFDHPEWARSYFKFCHRSDSFRSRWLAATGPWDGKVVVDVGCGPGNIFATVGGKPKLLIGVDVSAGSLELARAAGYLPLVADAHALPLRAGFADLVVLNAALHHCDDMPQVLSEAARLVAPGGLLVTDHDPQMSAWNFVGPAKWAWDLRLVVYLWLKKGFHRSTEEQSLALATEIHHEPGRGVTEKLYRDVLEPRGFAVQLFPHNHHLGAEVLQGEHGRADKKFRIAQRLSGIDPDAPEAGLSILCRARRALGRTDCPAVA